MNPGVGKMGQEIGCEGEDGEGCRCRRRKIRKSRKFVVAVDGLLYFLGIVDRKIQVMAIKG